MASSTFPAFGPAPHPRTPRSIGLIGVAALVVISAGAGAAATLFSEGSFRVAPMQAVQGED